MRLSPMIDDSATGQALPAHETANEIQATLAAVHDLIKQQATFDMPEQKTLILALLSEARYSLEYLSTIAHAMPCHELAHSPAVAD